MAAPMAAPTTSQPPSTARQPLTLDDIALHEKQRGFCVGMTESGKSTLSERMLYHWRREYGDATRILIVDSKPRFRAQWLTNGLPAKRLYKHWDHGAYFPGSYLLDLNNIKESLVTIFDRLGGHVAIAQGDRSTLPWLQFASSVFYNATRAKWKQLLYIDELADFYDTSGHGRRGDPFLQSVRSGRERGLAVLACSQRPRAIPKSVISEVTNAYVFELAYSEDVKHLQEMGLPETIDTAKLAREAHSFYFFTRDRKRRQLAGYYRLEVAA